MYYTCIACTTIDSVMRMNKKNYPQVYLEECKYKIKKIQTPRFINIELGTDSEPYLETDSELDTTKSINNKLKSKWFVKFTIYVSSIINEVIRTIISLLFFLWRDFTCKKKNTSKKHRSRFVLKIFKKELFIYL